MRFLSVLLIALFGTSQSTSVMELFGFAQTFMGTLHSIMQEGAHNLRESDPVDAETIEMFEYNWLSLVGYSKGILPLISDFYFNYFKQEVFMKHNYTLVQHLKELIKLFTFNGSLEDIYIALRKLIGGTLEKQLFQDGSIKDFLTEFDLMVNNKKLCMELIRLAKLKADDISEFLIFILKGAPKRDENANPNKSEL